MKKMLKTIGISVGALVAVLIVFLLGLTAFHRISLGLEQGQLIPPGHMVEVNGEMLHVYLAGENEEAPRLVFLPGQTISPPVYGFKPLYSLLADDYRVAVIEPFGFGYSDITDVPRDIDVVIAEMREALYYLGETGPFILIPHSMGGLDALRWAQRYPEEVAGIVGINMAHPAMWLDGHVPTQTPAYRRVTMWMGLQRLPFFSSMFYPYPYHEDVLTEGEHGQQRLLINRNAMNRSFASRTGHAFPSSQIIVNDGFPNVSMLLLVSRTSAIPYFVPYQEELARQMGAQIEFFDSGHALHQYEPERIASLIRTFISAFEEDQEAIQ